MRSGHWKARLAVGSATVLALIVVGIGSGLPSAAAAKSGGAGGKGQRVPTTSTTVAASSSALVQTRQANPARTIVTDDAGRWVATFTDGAVTVTIAGPARTFRESTTTATVTTSTWVRMLPAPFTGVVDESWLRAAQTDTSPDVLAVSMQYITGAPAIFDSSGRQIAGDAHYGPLQPDGTRQEGSDFGDYLGISWTYPDGTVDRPEADQMLSLDCSGFLRMTWGYRSGMQLSGQPDGVSLPRRAFQMYDSAPGVVTIANTGGQATTFDRLDAGDLVFFDVSTDDGTAIDHVGMYLGVDSAGRHRFVSSRKTVDGPTMGDEGGRSTVDGTGFYASGFRAARRL